MRVVFVGLLDGIALWHLPVFVLAQKKLCVAQPHHTLDRCVLGFGVERATNLHDASCRTSEAIPLKICSLT
jgi:hypothetical protein